MENDWKECINWLVKVGLISEDHILNSSSDQMLDLVKFLRDGVMLCKLLHLLDQNSIDINSVIQRPQNAQFICVKNINKFLFACSSYFDINKSDLFESQMLFEFTDISKVFHTLSKLSHCPKVASLNIPGFPQIQSSAGKNYSHEIYKTIQDKVNGNLPHKRLLPHHSESPYSCIEDDIYEELVPRYQERSPDKRELCQGELIETEKNYADALRRLWYNFYTPLKEIFGEQNCSVVFFKLKELVEIHSQLYRALNEAKSNSLNHSIAQIFVMWQEKLLIYGDYCANLSKSQETLEMLMSDDSIARKVRESEAQMSNRHYQLRDYLVVPLQRILKYHLLLGELLKHTPENHDEHYALKRAYECMLDVAGYINEVKRDKETLQIIDDLQSSITEIPDGFPNLKEMGRLKVDGEIKIEVHPEKNKTRFVFVFDKVMLLCKQAKQDERYLYKDHVMFEGCKIDNSLNCVSGPKRMNSFFVVVNGGKKAYTIITKSDDAKEKWLTAVSEAVENVNPVENTTKQHSFILTTFEKANIKCHVCFKLLKGCFFQGYECLVCQMIVHKKCLLAVRKCREEPTSPVSNSMFSLPPQWPEYWNLQVRDYPWWVERMSREEAGNALMPLSEETFLLRWSDKHNQPIVSIKAMGEVKHMRIHRHQKNLFYFSDTRYFNAIVELINFYRHTKLSECFEGLDRTLKLPIYDIAEVLFDYEARGANQLDLTEGQKVVVVSREGESMGWWKGRVGDKTGYFPKEYVKMEAPAMR